ncbi:hypothetical protein DPMN_046916 [Dreissena polymorpha]|uniref:Uncharacterized protein n=1 Tax=Dreissena polymorpha TaxID=45954 RepID=A0A9D4D8T0_DREPO|nr:hypothetical protein DPMN_046916 [Dreissena polymorpha]
MIINILAGILMCVGRNISMMCTDDDKPTGTTRRHPIDKSTGRRPNDDTDFDATHSMEEELEFGGELPKKRPLPGLYSEPLPIKTMRSQPIGNLMLFFSVKSCLNRYS